MKMVLNWVFKNTLIYIALVMAVIFGTFFLPRIIDHIGHDGLASELMSPAALAEQLGKDRDASLALAEKLKAEIATAPAEEVAGLLVSARAEREALEKELQAPPGLLASLIPREILSRKNMELRRAALEGEIVLLEAAEHRNRMAREFQVLRNASAVAVEPFARRCDQARRELQSFRSRFELDQVARNLVFHDEERLKRDEADECRKLEDAIRDRDAAERRIDQAAEALASADAAYLKASDSVTGPIRGFIIELTPTFRSIMAATALLMVGIILTPPLIRLFLYSVLAPLAQRRPPISLRHGEDVSHPVLFQASATSVPVTLEVDEELLVRQGFLQSTSTKGHKRTRALLDWRHPFSSLASGLCFLTRIVGEGESTTISAVRDPLAEVAVLDLTHRGACVLHPRALVAVVKKTDRRLRVTSHWRLFSLHAWLTLQLRYLMFHGPCLLVLKGGRGIRVERAESGRLFGQDQLVGFSPDLAYTVARTETFWPYFLGRESLFKDRVDAGGGIVIIEEAPLGGGRSGPRRGLEGALDIALKAVGL